MVLGSNLLWGIFMLKFGDPALAGMETFKVGPLIWSLLQLILIWIAHRQLQKMGKSLKALLGFSVDMIHKDFLKAIALTTASTFIILSITRGLEHVLFVNASKEDITFYPWAQLWWTTAGSLTAGFGEEIYFRGFLMERFRWMRPVWLLTVSSLSFSLWHVNPLLFPHTFVLGLLFGWIYMREGRLWPVILGHIFTNVIGGLLMLLGWF